ncbi:MAG: hypothetical protein ABIH09_03765, partial [Candidatus Omnitrophota bacterium]
NYEHEEKVRFADDNLLKKWGILADDDGFFSIKTAVIFAGLFIGGIFLTHILMPVNIGFALQQLTLTKIFLIVGILLMIAHMGITSGKQNKLVKKIDEIIPIEWLSVFMFMAESTFFAIVGLMGNGRIVYLFCFISVFLNATALYKSFAIVLRNSAIMAGEAKNIMTPRAYMQGVINKYPKRVALIMAGMGSVLIGIFFRKWFRTGADYLRNYVQVFKNISICLIGIVLGIFFGYKVIMFFKDTIFAAKQDDLQKNLEKQTKRETLVIAASILLLSLKLLGNWPKEAARFLVKRGITFNHAIAVVILYVIGRNLFSEKKEMPQEEIRERTRLALSCFGKQNKSVLVVSCLMFSMSIVLGIGVLAEYMDNGNIHIGGIIAASLFALMAIIRFYQNFKYQKVNKIKNAGIVIGVIGIEPCCVDRLDNKCIYKGFKIFSLLGDDMEHDQKILEENRRKYNAYYSGIIDVRESNVDEETLNKMIFELVRKIKNNKEVSSFHFKPETMVLNNRKACELKTMINKIMDSNVIVSRGLSELDIYDSKIGRIGEQFHVTRHFEGLKQNLIKLEEKRDFKVVSFKVDSIAELKWLAREHQKAINKYAGGNPDKYPVRLHVRFNNENVANGSLTRNNLEQILLRAGINRHILSADEILLGKEDTVWNITEYITKNYSCSTKTLSKDDILVVKMLKGIASQGYLAAVKVLFNTKNVPDTTAGMDVFFNYLDGIMYLKLSPINPIDLGDLRKEIENYEKLLIAA